MFPILPLWSKESVLNWPLSVTDESVCTSCGLQSESLSDCGNPDCRHNYCSACRHDKKSPYGPLLERYYNESGIGSDPQLRKQYRRDLALVDKTICPPCIMRGTNCAVCSTQVPILSSIFCAYAPADIGTCLTSGRVCFTCARMHRQACDNCKDYFVTCGQCRYSLCPPCKRENETVLVLPTQFCVSPYFSDSSSEDSAGSSVVSDTEDMEPSTPPDDMKEEDNNIITVNLGDWYKKEHLEVCMVCVQEGESVEDKQIPYVKCDGCRESFCCQHAEELVQCRSPECVYAYCTMCIGNSFKANLYRFYAYLRRAHGKNPHKIKLPEGYCLKCTMLLTQTLERRRAKR